MVPCWRCRFPFGVRRPLSSSEGARLWPRGSVSASCGSVPEPCRGGGDIPPVPASLGPVAVLLHGADGRFPERTPSGVCGCRRVGLADADAKCLSVVFAICGCRGAATAPRRASWNAQTPDACTLTPPSSGQPKACCAAFGLPLMSNVRPQLCCTGSSRRVTRERSLLVVGLLPSRGLRRQPHWSPSNAARPLPSGPTSELCATRVLPHTGAWPWPVTHRPPGSRRLTPPSSGRPPAGFACLRSPLMSNVRSH